MTQLSSAAQAAPLRASLVPAYAALCVAAFSFATNWIVGRGLADEVPPAAIAFWRWFFAAVLLAPFAIGPVRRDWRLLLQHWRVLFLLGLFGAGLFQLFVYWGLRYTTAINGALLNSALPILIVLFSALAFRQRLSKRMAAGVALSSIGVITLIVRGDLQVLARLAFNTGDLLVLAAIATWALYSIGLRWRPAGLHDMSFLAAIFAAGVAFSALWAAIEWGLGFRGSYTADTWLRLAWLGLFPSLVAYVCWNYGVARIGASRAGVFSHLIPVFAALLGFLLLGERLHLYHFAGLGLVLAGIMLSNRASGDRR